MSREQFSVVEFGHSVVSVCGMFGQFIKFVVVVHEAEDIEEQISSKRCRLDDEPICLKVPSRISKEKNSKDGLYNDLVNFCNSQNLGWEEPDSVGKKFITDLSNTLWYIDGHHRVLSSRSCDIPNFFSNFTGYNRPEKSKHRKRSISNLKRDKLLELASNLQEHVVSSWIQRHEWCTFRVALSNLIEAISLYASYLNVRNDAMKVCHSSSEPVNFAEASNVRFMKKTSSVSSLLASLDDTVKSSTAYETIRVNEFTPSDRRKRYLYIRELEKGLSCNVFFLTYTHVSSYHVIWKAPEDASEESCTSENLKVVERIREEIPLYHSRAMKHEFFTLCGRITPKSKPHVLRAIYNALTGECSASRTTAESEVDARVSEVISMEDPDIIIDLRECNNNGQDRFAIFWDKCNQFLTSCTSVQERRHGTISFMAKAFSVRDLIEQVTKLCSADIPIPSESWVRFNFCPRNPLSKVASRYTCRLNAKHMVQKRQFRKSHPDAHYCASIFRYLRDYAIKYRDIATFVCIDDKHRVKVGEPNFPVAAVERGKEVIVSLNETFVVGDHDFCKFSLIPSVILVNEIPPSFEGSWYAGQVYVGLKDAVFEPSSPVRHATELYNIMKSRNDPHHILFIYSDGGPDHRLTYLSVQISLISLFLKLDLDLLIAGRTAPSHSWANPVERVMSVINLGLQSVGVMRAKGGEDLEKALLKCSSLKKIRMECAAYKEDVKLSLSPTKELISNVLKRLELKGKKFEIFNSASDEEISELWDCLLTIDQSLSQDISISQSTLKGFPSLVEFISHCCTFHKYSLTIKKCGKSSCTVCTPVKMDPEVFKGTKLFYAQVIIERNVCKCVCTCAMANCIVIVT